MRKGLSDNRASTAVMALAKNFATPGLLKGALGLALGAITIPLTQAQTTSFSVNTGYARYHYEESGLMQLSGQQYVVGGRAVVNFDTGYALIAEGRYAGAEVDYASSRSGSSHGQPLSIHEFRLLGGATHQWRNLDFRPFAGIGVRRLRNDAQGLTTTTGDSGYLRVSTYKYLPLGVNLDIGSALRMAIEYDHLLNGGHDSHLPGELIHNRQSRGHGYRASIIASYEKWVTEPYFQRWDIAESDEVSCFDGFYLCREPENFTTEIGISFRYIF